MESPADLLYLVSGFHSLRICSGIGCADGLLGGYAFVALFGGGTWAAFKFVVDSL